MKKRSDRTDKPRRRKHDRQIEEFERRDLSKDIRSSGSLIVVHRAKPTSILLDEDLITALRKKGAKRGLGYQTMLKMIVREHLHEY